MVSNGHGSGGQEDDSTQPWNPASRSEHNPFIAFRQMVDHQFSTMVRTLDEQTHQPAQNASERRRREQRSDAPDDTQSRLFGIFSQPPLYERAMTRGTEQDSQEQETPSSQQGCGRWRNRWGWHNHHHHHHHRHHEDSVSKYDERADGAELDNPGSALATHHHGSFGPVIAALFSPHIGMTSYETWRVFSPYSPAHLATDPSLPATMQSRWHLAFLDLLALHNGEQMMKPSESRRADRIMDLQEVQSRLFRSKDRRAANWEDEEAGKIGGEGFGAMGHWALGPHQGGIWSIGHGNEQDGGWMSTLLDNFFAGSQTGQDHKTLGRRFKEETAQTEEDMYRWFLQQQGTDYSEKPESTRHDPRLPAKKTNNTNDTDTSNYPIPAYSASSMNLPRSTPAHDSSEEQLAAEATARTVEQAQKLHRSHQPGPFSWFQHDEHRSNMQRTWARAREEEGKEQRQTDTVRGGAGASAGARAGDNDADTVVATLTQSHTTRSSDGSSRTISRVTRRFADGREETREDVDEGPASLSSSVLSNGTAKSVPGLGAADASSKQERRAGGGWFWS